MEFDELYKIITKYYPIGINELDPGYLEHPGIKEILSISKVMFNVENYDQKWKNFINSFQDEINGIQEVNAESSLSEWCYTGSLLIHKKTIENITHSQEIIIDMSFLTPVYTIYGRDKIELSQDVNLIEFNPFLTISPYGIYEKLFNYSKKKVESCYSSYRFISFSILSEKVQSIFVPGSINGQDSTVYQALFKYHDITNFPYQGDPSYK